MSSLDGNQIVQALGMEHENPYVKDTILFFYVVAVMATIKGAKNIVHQISIATLRGFGSYGFALPLVLGALPSKMYSNFDSNICTIVAAIIFTTCIVDRIIPADMQKYMSKINDFAYCIVKGNAAGHGFVMVAAAVPDSQIAPFVGAYIAVNGHRLLEKGIGAIATASYDGDSLLGIIGGIIYYAAIEYVRVSSLVARVMLIIFRISAEYIDYNSIQANISSAIGSGSKATGASGGRGRSRTPKRK